MSNIADKTLYFLAKIARRLIIVLVYALLLFIFLFIPSFIEQYNAGVTLNVCAFTETFCPEVIQRFEREKGVKVNLTYVELDEQLFAKFKVNEGDGYDVINISDFMVQILAKQGYLQPIDHARIPNIDRLRKNLLNQMYDPKNCYSVPHKWFMYGIIYDRTFFTCLPEQMNLDFIFKNPQEIFNRGLARHSYKICMLDSPQDSFFFAAKYLFGTISDLTADQIEKIQTLLIEQKKWVECYTLYNIEYFMSTGLIPIALTASNFVRKMWSEESAFEFIIPKEGGILVVENLAIPKCSKKKQLAQQFIDFMISDRIATINSSFYGWASANKKANQLVDQRYQRKSDLFPDDHIFDRLSIPLFSQSMRSKIDDIWLEVGFA